MKKLKLYRFITAASLGIAVTDASALAAAQVYPGVGDAGVPVAFGGLVWIPVVALVFALGLALLWLLRTPATARKVQTSATHAPSKPPRRNRRLPGPVLAQRRPRPHRRAVMPA